MSGNQNALSEQWGNFLDLNNDVKPWLGIPPTQTTRDAQLQFVIDGVCDWLQRELGRPVGRTRFDRRFDGWQGWNGAHFFLPYYPVLEVVTVTEWWGVSGPHSLQEQTPTNQVDGFTVNYLTGRMTRVFPGLVEKPWFPGHRNIEVVWDAGYEPVPPSLRLGCAEAIKYWWDTTQQVSRAFPNRAEQYDAATVQSEFFGATLPNILLPMATKFTQVNTA